MPNININQFAQVPIRGQLDLQIMKSGVIQGFVSASQATALKAGDAVKLDTASGLIPSFLAAAASDVCIGYVVFDEKKTSPVAGDYIQVTFFGGPVMWLTALGTIAAGTSVEDDGSGNVQALAAGKMRGIALDPGVAGQLMRVICRNSLQS